ncbi:MAG: bifunctional phosphopantothenoylcysteine decarboxylase/phosphopantothenate--cysteine ligase CoaBC [Actinomycetota bacterium]|nr:bifunctional phosphopantothenoylcysteine decarboxylase/phosphopantothenate--cysteine ligase CoaBC [Actinomycetota bacterium]
MASVFEGKKIVLGVTGSIAAYKAAQVCSHLVKMGAIVYPVMTPNALNFLGISTLSALSGNETIYDQFRGRKTEHISPAHSADVVVIAPATANTISKLATGICDNFLTTTALAATCPVLIAPAMNESMYIQQSLQENIRKLESWGKFFFTGPAEGRLACGEEGKGKMVEPDKILDSLSEVLSFSRQLEDKTVLVTAGGTREYIDSVRYISNASSGKMGHALAREAKLRGAKRVILITSARNLNRPLGRRLWR